MQVPVLPEGLKRKAATVKQHLGPTEKIDNQNKNLGQCHRKWEGEGFHAIMDVIQSKFSSKLMILLMKV